MNIQRSPKILLLLLALALPGGVLLLLFPLVNSVKARIRCIRQDTIPAKSVVMKT